MSVTGTGSRTLSPVQIRTYFQYLINSDPALPVDLLKAATNLADFFQFSKSKQIFVAIYNRKAHTAYTVGSTLFTAVPSNQLKTAQCSYTLPLPCR